MCNQYHKVQLYITRLAGMDMYNCPRYHRMALYAQHRIPIMVTKRENGYITKDGSETYKFNENELTAKRPVCQYNGTQLLFTEEDVEMYNIRKELKETQGKLNDIQKRVANTMLLLYHEVELQRDQLKDTLQRN